MKERSVAFYKRLILSAALIIVIILASVTTYAVGKALNFWDNDQKNADGGKTVLQSQDYTEAADKTGDVKENSDGSEVKQENTAGSTDTKEVSAKPQSDKMVYLTFEDGASKNTSRILEVLKKNDVNATFFFNTNEEQTSDEIIKEAYDCGNEIGILTSEPYSYKKIYASVESYLADFEESYNRIKNATGKAPEVVRFPGGSINGYNSSNYKEIIAAVENKGFTYFDWNVCADNGSASASKESMIRNGTKLPGNSDICIVLIHDNGNTDVCEALEYIISFYKENGYGFGVLSPSVKQITF